MSIDQFAEKWQVKLSPQAQKLCALAWILLEESKDPAHDEKHVTSILKNADRLLERETGLKDKISFEVLILSIVWHDIWKASFIPHNALQLLYAFCWDGMGSRNMFMDFAKHVGLDKRVTARVAYAIKKHHSVQFLPRKTLEAKILKDCDELELWSLSRAKTMYEFILQSMTGKGMRKLIRRYSKIKLKSSVKTVYFDTTAQLLKSKMRLFLKEFDEELETF